MGLEATVTACYMIVVVQWEEHVFSYRITDSEGNTQSGPSYRSSESAAEGTRYALPEFVARYGAKVS